jgi:hypothetical protein
LIAKHTLACTSDRGNTVTIGPEGVLSGMGECRDNPQCADSIDEGPVPPGEYDMVPSNMYGGSWWLDEGRLRRIPWKFGIGRAEFFLHLGTRSKGCITVEKTDVEATKDFRKLRLVLNLDPKNTLSVQP